VVEIVVIVLIVLVLAAILFPLPRGHPRRSAGRAMCGSNLLSIGAALATYAADHEDLCPPSPAWAAALRPRLRSSGQFVCPKAKQVPVGYAYGSYLACCRLGELKQPGTVLAFWDAEPGVQTFAFRHVDGLNVGYADGHAGWRSAEELHRALLEGYASGITLSPPPSG